MKPNTQTLTDVLLRICDTHKGLKEKNGKPYCTYRRLIINPSENCKTCAYNECRDHKHHIDGYTMSQILARDKVAYGRTHPSKGTKRPWDGTREDCRRYRRFGNDPKTCKRCTLDRDCRYRGEEGELDRDIAKRLKWEKKRQERKKRKPLTPVQVDWIRNNAHRYSQKALARLYKVSPSTISAIINRETHRF